MLLPIAGVDNDASGAVCMGDDGAIHPIHPYGLDITSIIVSEVETLVDPIIC